MCRQAESNRSCWSSPAEDILWVADDLDGIGLVSAAEEACRYVPDHGWSPDKESAVAESVGEQFAHLDLKGSSVANVSGGPVEVANWEEGYVRTRGVDEASRGFICRLHSAYNPDLVKDL